MGFLFFKCCTLPDLHSFLWREVHAVASFDVEGLIESIHVLQRGITTHAVGRMGIGLELAAQRLIAYFAAPNRRPGNKETLLWRITVNQTRIPVGFQGHLQAIVSGIDATQISGSIALYCAASWSPNAVNCLRSSAVHQS